MNIQDYYKKTALVSLNASIVSLGPPLLFMSYGMITGPNKNFVLLILPFLVYSLICYHFFLLNHQRANETSIVNRDLETGLLDQNHVLLTFLPAPSLRMQMFDSHGFLLGEIKDMQFKKVRWFLPNFFDSRIKKKYGLYDHGEQLRWTFTIKNNHINITDVGKNMTTTYEIIYTKGLIYMNCHGESKLQVKHSSLFTDCQFMNMNGSIGRLRRGWMPVEWANRFKDANAPIVTFNDKIQKEDKSLIYAVIVLLFRYSNH